MSLTDLSNSFAGRDIVAGPRAPGQYAQLDGTLGAIEVGRVTIIDGAATATRADGTQVELAVGSPVYQGDALATGEGAALALVFADGTSFSLGAEARMVVDEFVYDAGGGADKAAFDVLQGVFAFVSGDVAKDGPDAMTLTTPVATIGIRGTALALRILAAGLESLIALLRDPDGDLGSVTVATQADSVVLDDENEGTVVTSLLAPPGGPFILAPTQLTDLFGALLAQLGLDPTVIDEDADGDVPDDASGGEADGGGSGFIDVTAGALLDVEFVLRGGVVTSFLPESTYVTVTDQLVLAGISVAGFAFIEPGVFAILLSVPGLGDDDDVLVPIIANVDELIFGTDGDDVLIGTDVSTGIFAGAGNDSLFGFGGDDTLFGEAGNDVVDGGDSNDQLAGDGLFGAVGDDLVRGGAGDDVLVGDNTISLAVPVGGNDALFGEEGNDVLQPGPGVDTYDGGPGRDLLELFDGTQGANINLGLGQAFNDGFGNAETFSGIEDVKGTQFADSIVGDPGANELSGSDGDDVLIGSGGSDDLFGEDGNDILMGGAGRDTLEGDAAPGFADIFSYFDKFDGSQVAANVTRGAVLGDTIIDFVSGEDTIRIDLTGFGGGLGGLGPLVLGQNLSVIGVQYDGTNPGVNGNFPDSQPTFVFSTADDTLYFDDNGIGAGYTVIATFANGEAPVAADFDVVFGG
ncbi:MAG: FecR domain-containing protein [Alphaproteobacteria bacterium]